MKTDYDAVVIGAGFAGLYMLHRLREDLGMSVRVYEKGGDVGGTWYWNRYPGARCDTESYVYCYSFSPELCEEWTWSGKYPNQPEILAYLEHVADRFDLRPDIEFGTTVTAAHFDEENTHWRIETDRGEVVTARYFITGLGLLASAPHTPRIPGLESFEGPAHHTGRWPHEPVEFTGKRVGVIGTGATGIQMVPELAAQAEHVYVFQRTPQFAIPARPENVGPADLEAIKRRYDEVWEHVRWSANGFPWQHSGVSALEVDAEERDATFDRLWAQGGFQFVAGSFRDLLLDRRANDFAAEFIRARIREMVSDPDTAEMLLPVDHPVGSRRPVIDTGYYESFNRPNVTLVDIRSNPITTVTPTGVATETGTYDFDVLLLATGFDAVTGPFMQIDIRGRSGEKLAEKWAGGPRTYMGLATAGFPNMFMITGPAATFGNLVVSIEHHVEWITACIRHIEETGTSTIEASRESEDAWMEHVEYLADHTIIPLSNSWFNGGNIPGKPRSAGVYFGNFGLYRKRCEDVAEAGYEGFLVDGVSRQPHDRALTSNA